MSLLVVCLRGLRYGGLAAWIGVASLLAAAVLSIVVLLGAARSPGSRRTGACVVVAVGCLAVGLTAAAWVLVQARRRMLDPSPCIDIVDFRWSFGVEVTEDGLLLMGVGLTWCASLLALSALIAAVRPGGLLRGATRRAVLFVSLAALAATAGLGLIRRANAWSVWLEKTGESLAAHPHPCVRRQLLHELVATLTASIADARAHLLVVAAIGCAAAALASRPRSSSPRRAWSTSPYRLASRPLPLDGEAPLGVRAATGSAALFLLGVAAFAATRGMAHDARHPIPMDGTDLFHCPRSDQGFNP